MSRPGKKQFRSWEAAATLPSEAEAYGLCGKLDAEGIQAVVFPQIVVSTSHSSFPNQYAVLVRPQDHEIARQSLAGGLPEPERALDSAGYNLSVTVRLLLAPFHLPEAIRRRLRRTGEMHGPHPDDD